MRAGAHRARLQGHVEIAAIEPLVAQRPRRGADRDDLGVSGRIVVLSRAIAGAGDHGAIPDDDRADRRFAPRLGGARLGEGGAHRVLAQAPLPSGITGATGANETAREPANFTQASS